jgi:hypothetical protein
MAKQAHLQRLIQGVSLWNAWRKTHAALRIDLRGAHLSWVNFRGVDLRGADLSAADLRGADLTQADLTHADLTEALVILASLQEATLHQCRIYGIAVWDVDMTGAEQSGLILTLAGAPTITVDHLLVAQWLALVQHHPARWAMLDTTAWQVALLLGRFTPARHALFEALREVLHQRHDTPVRWDVDPPLRREMTDMLALFLHLARCVIVDLTDTGSLPQVLLRIVPAHPAVLMQPVLLASPHADRMWEPFQRLPGVVAPVRYERGDQARRSLAAQRLEPLEAKIAAGRRGA